VRPFLPYHAALRPSSQIPPGADPRPKAASPGDPRPASRPTTSDRQPINPCESVQIRGSTIWACIRADRTPSRFAQVRASIGLRIRRGFPHPTPGFQLTITDPMQYNTTPWSETAPNRAPSIQASSTQHPASSIQILTEPHIDGSTPHPRSLIPPRRPRPPTDTENRNNAKQSQTQATQAI